MAKALYGFMGEPRASMLLKQVSDLQKRIEELERALAVAEAEVIMLREMADAKVDSNPREEIRERALA